MRNYKLKITIEPIKIEADGTERSYGSTMQTYLGLTYENLVKIQKVSVYALVEALFGLADARIKEEQGK